MLHSVLVAAIGAARPAALRAAVSASRSMLASREPNDATERPHRLLKDGHLTACLRSGRWFVRQMAVLSEWNSWDGYCSRS